MSDIPLTPDGKVSDYTIEDYLGGKIRLNQLRHGYRAASDAVLLASVVKARKGQTVLDVGTGTGAVALCVAARLPDVSLTGIELQPELAACAVENVAFNAMADRISVVTADIRARRIDGVPTGSFDWVVTNPPYITEDQVSPDKTRDIAHRESDCPLPEWVCAALRYLKAGGSFAMINRADRLPEILSVMSGKLGGLKIIPVWTKQNRPAKRVIVIGRKGSKSPAVLDPGIVLNDENGNRTAIGEALMREGKPFPFPAP